MKYEYWAYLLLKNFFRKSQSYYIIIYNKLNDTLKVYDFRTQKDIKYKFKENLDFLFTVFSYYINIDEFEEFYLSLPKEKQEEIWRYGC